MKYSSKYNTKDVYTRISKWLLLVFSLFLLVYGMFFGLQLVGEWPSYVLTTASLINDQNLSISEDDNQAAARLFQKHESYMLSNNAYRQFYSTQSGVKTSWYFLTYSLVCVPSVLALYFIGFPALYGFLITNILLYLFSIFVVYKYGAMPSFNKLILICLLVVNPALFYVSWASAEIFIFSFLVMSTLFWTNGSFKRAAILLSIAGTMNIVVMWTGILMIIDYFITLSKSHKIKNISSFITALKKEYKGIFAYASCYLICLVPCVYNYYLDREFILTASGVDLPSLNDVFQRALAYLFDLNYGMLPYFTFVFLVFVIITVLSVIKRNYKALLLSFSLLGLVLSYSIMPHINCGMSGIARYNAWSSVLLVFCVALYFTDVFKSKAARRIVCVLIGTGITLTAITVTGYGAMYAYRTSSEDMTPIAKYVLNNYPGIYNPLHSTFNSRANHIAGGYHIETPVYYRDDDARVRKILASKEDRSTLLENLNGDENSIQYLTEQVDKLKNGELSYISFGREYSLETEYEALSINDRIWFSTDDYNAGDYAINSILINEGNYSWTNGNKMLIRFKAEGYEPSDHLTMRFNYCMVYKDHQRVIVTVNKREVCTINTRQVDDFFEFDIPANELPYIEVQLYFPDSIRPCETILGMPADTRDLAIGLTSAFVYS